MRPRKSLPKEPPFLTLWTTSYMRPQALARNMESVAKQTAVEHVEQLVFPDHVGYGWDAMYERVKWYASAARGNYVAWLNDDDALAGVNAVANLMKMARQAGDPEVLVVRVKKGTTEFPRDGSGWPPAHALVDLGSYVVRRDIWLQHLNDYGHRYEGDYDHAAAMYLAGRKAFKTDLLFAEGAAGGGRPEVDWR
jgi:hypothetical protein